MSHRITLLLSWVFGLLLLALSLFVTLETILRKLANFSFQGADELGGYVLAVGGALSFSVTLLERGHIRIDLLHDRFGPQTRAVLNWLSALSLGLFGLFIARYAWPVVRDTLAYGSTAPTAWATPMIYPQSVWYGCLLLFTLSSVYLAVRATLLFMRKDTDALNQQFDPKATLDELAEELDDIGRR